MIIVEGPDNAGKTTLCNTLSRELNKGIIHSPNHKDMMSSTEKWFEWIIQSLTHPSNAHIIYDRHPLISEQVYGPVLRRHNFFGDGRGAAFYHLLLKSNPLIIYCKPPEENLMDFGDREQLEGVIDNANLLAVAYDAFMHDLFHHELFNGDVIKYDYTSNSIEYVTEAIEEYENEITKA